MIVGIDLGTTNSLIAYFDNNEVTVIPNRLGGHLTPSIVSMGENDEIYVGAIAKERKVSHPEMTVEVFKRSMGTEKEFFLGEKKFKAEELSSFVLRSLKEDAEEYLGQEVKEAIISVPAYFNDAQRKATCRAGELAGFKVERIVSEPTAAAIAYGLDKRDSETKFLVFDLGGGTFDVSILELYKNIMEVRAVAGDNYLGGEDFTEIIYQMFLKENELKEDVLGVKTIAHIKRQAELTKLAFSEKREVTMKCSVNGEEIEYNITLDEYERACEMLFAKIRRPIERSLKDANVKLSEVDEIILIGGATKLPIVHRFVSKLFGCLPNTSINPDEAVALGAALQGAMKERNEAIKEIILTDVCPFTLGTEVVVDRENGRTESGHFCPIIERNTVIPVSRRETLYTASDYQTHIRVAILQGESRFAKNNLLLGEIEVSVPKKKRGEESINVTYTYDVNSILEVIVKVNSTKEEKRVVIQKEGGLLSDEEIEARMQELSYLKIHPREQEENKLLLAKAERMYEEYVGDNRMMLEEYIRKFEDVLDKQDKSSIERARKEFREILEEFEDEDFDY